MILRTAAEMRAILAANPFPDAEPSRIGVSFLGATLPSGTQEAATGRTGETIVLGACEVFVHHRLGRGRTTLRFPAMADGTVRTVNAIAKLANMAGGGG